MGSPKSGSNRLVASHVLTGVPAQAGGTDELQTLVFFNAQQLVVLGQALRTAH
ncbi:hypothetical protein D3C78_1943020 [compost metagenome]